MRALAAPVGHLPATGATGHGDGETMVDGRESLDGQRSEPAQDLGWAAPGSSTSGAQPQSVPPAPGVMPPSAPTYQAPLPYVPYGQQPPRSGPEAPGNPQATASLVLGIVSVFLSVLFVPSIIGVALGVAGLVRSGRTDPPTGRGKAVTGIALSVIGAVLGVFIVVAGTNSLSNLAERIEQESASTSTGEGDGSTGGSAESAAPDLESFEQVDAELWKSVVKDPDGAEGRAVVVFAEVMRFDSTTGPDRFLAAAGVDQPGSTGELQDPAVIIGDDASLDGVETGDVLRVHAVLTGSVRYETTLGGVSTIPTLTITKIEDLGFGDLSEDIALGAAENDALGWTVVPATVTNSGGRTYTYSATVVAESEDGKTSYGKGTVYVENLEPGQKEEVVVDFLDELPADAVFRFDFLERYIE